MCHRDDGGAVALDVRAHREPQKTAMMIGAAPVIRRAVEPTLYQVFLMSRLRER